MKETFVISWNPFKKKFLFKRIFGMEANKDLLLAFLNVLFRGRKQIEDLHYNKNEHVGVADRYLSM
ncbi:Rpn family recombination-promoting nuclease/putative transposase [Sphingobacterium sp. xlx-130]|uniref:Rpn family recombination-promoting nuclease/putative transposase n=1 Tax=Sphingobacterium sp. xlx-130 TaxID=2654323 RepID=UPI0021D27BA1|nr:Rpn family recombination-promoting nuclease/putative transposase [Sphingobacterium sp. xlx-130]